MSILNGYYTIYNTSVEAYVGRHLVEDRSLNPKRVLALPHGHEQQIWKITTVSDGKATLSTRGSEVGTNDGRIFASLLDEPAPDEVKIAPTGPQNEYTIESSGGYWYLSGGLDSEGYEDSQIKLGSSPQTWRIVLSSESDY